MVLGCSPEAVPEPAPGLDDVRLHLNLGDSVAAGFNAAGNNGPGGRAYARLLFENHPDHPDWQADHLRALFPDAELVDRSQSGATSADVVLQTLALPETAGDAVVTIYVGGNDFNDDAATMLVPEKTDETIARWKEHMTSVVSAVREAYRAPDRGREVAIALATIHEPTDGMLSIPAAYDDGFCAMLSQLDALDDETKQTIYANYLAFNDAIRAHAEALAIDVVVDAQRLFTGHGLNTELERWIDDDCAHLTDAGHHALRSEVWSLLAPLLRAR
jgi:lysophospholipase L1-like esterase